MGKDGPAPEKGKTTDPEWGADFDDIEEGSTSDYEPTVTEAPSVGRKFQITKLLGKGGMGQVYLARDRDLGRMVALKVLSKELSHDVACAERLRREARAVASIGHPNIVQVFEIGETEDGCPFIAMEMLEGRDLGEELEKAGRLATARAVDICGQVLFALSSAHRSGVVHRDLKPANVFLTRREIASWTDLQASKDKAEVAKILDFGISRFLDPVSSSPKLTSTGVVLGTPYYMAPEQIRGMESLDGRADLFAVGVILYECLTGKLPFTGDNIHSLLHHVLVDPAPDPKLFNLKIPAELAGVVMRALEKNPDKRFQSADEFIAALRPFHEVASKDSWSGRPFESRASRNVDETRGADSKTIALATGDVTPVAQAELTATEVDVEPTDGLAVPVQTFTPSDEPIAPELVPTASPRSIPRGALLGAGLLVVSLIVGVVTVSSMRGAGDDDATRSTVGPPVTPQTVDASGSAGEPTEQQKALVVSQDAGRSTHDGMNHDDAVDAQPGSPERTSQDVDVDAALEEARACLRRRDRECCMSALEGAPRTRAVTITLRRCRRAVEREVHRPSESAAGTTGTTNPSNSTDVPVAREAPW